MGEKWFEWLGYRADAKLEVMEEEVDDIITDEKKNRMLIFERL
jgi:hypothetical protein